MNQQWAAASSFPQKLVIPYEAYLVGQNWKVLRAK